MIEYAKDPQAGRNAKPVASVARNAQPVASVAPAVATGNRILEALAALEGRLAEQLDRIEAEQKRQALELAKLATRQIEAEPDKPKGLSATERSRRWRERQKARS